MKQKTKQKPTNEQAWKAVTIMLGLFILLELVFIFVQPKIESNVKVGSMEIPQGQLNLLLSQVDVNQPATICDIETDTCLVVMIKENKPRS
jgi:hypothetical protein